MRVAALKALVAHPLTAGCELVMVHVLQHLADPAAFFREAAGRCESVEARLGWWASHLAMFARVVLVRRDIATLGQ